MCMYIAHVHVAYDFKYLKPYMDDLQGPPLCVDLIRASSSGLRTTKAQTCLRDQRLCYLLIGKHHIKLDEQNFNCLASLCS